MTDPTTAPTAAAVDPAPTTDEPPLRVGVLLFAGVEPLDAIGPAQVFWSLDSSRRFLPPFRATELLLVAEEAGPVHAGHGLVLHADVSYADCPPLDVVIVPGGTGRDVPPGSPESGRLFQAQHRPTIYFVAGQAAGAEVMASVCTGAFILTAAGLVDGHRVNTHWSARDELAAFLAGRGETAEIVAERVVDDGRLVTGGGVSSGIDIALHLVERLLGPTARAGASAVIEEETPVG